MTTFRQAVWRHVIAVLVILMGIANILSSVVVRVVTRERLVEDFLPLVLMESSRHLAVVAGLALIALGRGLWRGKRGPWMLAVALLLGSAVVHTAKGLDLEESAAALALMAVLLWQHDAFLASPDRPSIARAFGALLLSTAGLLVYAIAGTFMLRTQFAPTATTVALLQELAARLMLGTGPLHPLSRRALWFLESFSVVGVAMLAYLLGAFLHPIVAAPAAAADRQRALDLLRRYARSSLAYFALLPDKSLYFGREVEGLIAFRVAADVAVVCGDPIVARENLQQLLAEFMQHCVRHGWELCLYEIGMGDLHVYNALGFRTLKIGEDAWIDLPNFTLKGKPIADVRHAVSKIERDGLAFEVLDVHAGRGSSPAMLWEHHGEPHQVMDARASALWKQMHTLAQADRGDFELQFSFVRLPPIPDPEARYTLAVDPGTARVLGFCAWLPMYAVNGWALDVMQRAEDAPNGTMEYVIAQSLLHFQGQGATWASLGMAPLADADLNAEDERSLLQRGVRFLYEHPQVNKLYRYKSLFFFKRKFVPTWRSAYLAYTSPLSLPRVLFAVLRVHLPEIGPATITDFLLAQSEKGVERWRQWLRTRPAAQA